MKLFSKAKDGGPLSRVTGYWLLEVKGLVSAMVLRFGPGSRESYHSHAFTSVSWLLRGHLREEMLDGRVVEHKPSMWPVVTHPNTFHRVFSDGTSWVLSFRGPWRNQWMEWTRDGLDHGRFTGLTSPGRQIVWESPWPRGDW